MNNINSNLQIISAPSTLGLQSMGVERLAETLLACGLQHKLKSDLPIIDVPVLNHKRSKIRDAKNHCLNPTVLRDFSIYLSEVVRMIIDKEQFPFILGGDCSILLGILPALKTKGTYGLIFIDAHADFYEPEKSSTGEVADMDLAIVTGRGPEILTNINGLKPYVLDKNVIHLAQRDEKQTEEYQSQDIRETDITCFSLETIRKQGLQSVIEKVLHHITTLNVDGFWIHFDTDVLADDINPAVDYRLPGGLQFNEAANLIHTLLGTGKIAGISVTVYNANLDPTSHIAAGITDCLSNAFHTPTN